MTHLFQPLDLTVNGHCKKLMKNEFAKWYMQQVDNALQAGTKLEGINIEFHLSVIEQLHAKWLVEYYNHISSKAGTEVIVNGFKRGIRQWVGWKQIEDDEDTQWGLEDGFKKNAFGDFIIDDEQQNETLCN